MKAALVALVVGACGHEPASQPAAPLAPAPPTPAPPAGTVLPLVGTVREIHNEPYASYRWKAIYTIDPADPRFAHTEERSPGCAALRLYFERAKAAGMAVTDDGSGFEYPIQNGALSVLVRCDKGFDGYDPNGFTVWVGIPGG